MPADRVGQRWDASALYPAFRPAARLVRLALRVGAASGIVATRQVGVRDWPLGRFVGVANVHMVMEAHDDPVYRRVVREADLVTPDGVLLVWGLRAMGVRDASRVYGPTLTLHVCEAAAREVIAGYTMSALRSVGISFAYSRRRSCA